MLAFFLKNKIDPFLFQFLLGLIIDKNSSAENLASTAWHRLCISQYKPINSSNYVYTQA